jgi:hypothetical protein
MRLPDTKFTIPALWLGMSVLAIVCTACEAHGQAKTSLRWRFQKGDQLHYVVEVDDTSSTKVSVPGEPTIVTRTAGSSTVEFAWTVGAVADDGTAQVSAALERVRIAAKSTVTGLAKEAKTDPVGGEFSEDTRTEPPSGSETSKALRALIGGTLTFRMTPRGEIRDTKFSDRLAKALSGALAYSQSEDSLKESLQRIALVLPGEAVATGAQWTARIDKPTPGFAFETRDFFYTYRGPSVDPDRRGQIIDVKTKRDIKADPKGAYRMELRYKSQDGKGTVHFDNVAGHLLSIELTQKFEVGMTMLGDEIVTPGEQHVKVSLKGDGKLGPRQ